MNTILVPTDFSDNAANALNYAIGLAKKTEAKIILLHAYQIPYMVSDAPINYTAEQIEAVRAEAEIKLNDQCAGVNAKQVKCTAINMEGLIADVILETIVKKRIPLVVMGTRGASGLKRIVLGSNTARVIQDAKCPVLAIPKDVQLKRLKKISYATDYMNGDAANLKKLIELTDPYHPVITLVHVSNTKAKDEQEKDVLKSFTKKMKENAAYKNIIANLLFGKNPNLRLDEYVQEERPDLLVMSTQHRTFTEKLIRTSSTKRMVYHSLVPLLVFHNK